MKLYLKQKHLDVYDLNLKHYLADQKFYELGSIDPDTEQGPRIDAATILEQVRTHDNEISLHIRCLIDLLLTCVPEDHIAGHIADIEAELADHRPVLTMPPGVV